MTEFLADHTHSFRPVKTEIEQFRHAVLCIPVSQPMRSGRPTKHGFTGFTKYKGEIHAAREIVVLLIFDVPVYDSFWFSETNVFEISEPDDQAV